MHCIELENRVLEMFSTRNLNRKSNRLGCVALAVVVSIAMYSILSVSFSALHAHTPVSCLYAGGGGAGDGVGGRLSAAALAAPTTAATHYMHPHASTTMFGNVFWVAVLLLSI